MLVKGKDRNQEKAGRVFRKSLLVSERKANMKKDCVGRISDYNIIQGRSQSDIRGSRQR